jgi:acyl-CoA dehydrogenase
MRASSHLDSLFALQGIGSYAIAVAGTDEQREEWLPRVARAEVLAALALTEPVAGSDLRGIESTLVADGDEVELNGAKSFISNGGAAGFYTTMAKEGDRFSLVLVPADAPGVSIEPSPEIIAPHVLGEVVFDRVRLPASARLGEPGAGFRHVLATLSVFRISVAGAAVGLMDGALTCAANHAATREQFGRPLGAFQALQHRAVDDFTRIAGTRSLLFRIAGGEGDIDPAMAAALKAHASDSALRVAKSAIQMHGAIAFTDEHDAGLYLKRAMTLAAWLGNAAAQRARYAEAML